jgi:hypothetical protein
MGSKPARYLGSKEGAAACVSQVRLGIVAVEPGFATSGVCVRGCVAALRTCVRGLSAASWVRGPSWAREMARQSGAARLYLVSATKKTGIGEGRWRRRRRTHSPALGSSVSHLPSHCVVVGVFVFVRARPRSFGRSYCLDLRTWGRAICAIRSIVSSRTTRGPAEEEKVDEGRGREKEQGGT